MSGLVQSSRFAPAQVKSSKSGVRGAIERQLIPLAIIATTSLMMVPTVTVAQSSVPQNAGRSSGATQSSTCAADVQGLMCLDNHPLEEAVQGQAAQTTTSAASLPPLLSNAQMERLADLLLGLLYFVLPIGFGVGLFLHDRQQAQRMATLEAQIKLLERLWNQTPQA